MRPFNSLYDPAIDSIALRKKEHEERNKSNSISGQFPRTIYDGIAISTGSETGVQTAAHLIVKNNYEQARGKERKRRKSMQSGCRPENDNH